MFSLGLRFSFVFFAAMILLSMAGKLPSEGNPCIWNDLALGWCGFILGGWMKIKGVGGAV